MLLETSIPNHIWTLQSLSQVIHMLVLKGKALALWPPMIPCLQPWPKQRDGFHGAQVISDTRYWIPVDNIEIKEWAPNYALFFPGNVMLKTVFPKSKTTLRYKITLKGALRNHFRSQFLIFTVSKVTF